MDKYLVGIENTNPNHICKKNVFISSVTIRIRLYLIPIPCE